MSITSSIKEQVAVAAINHNDEVVTRAFLLHMGFCEHCTYMANNAEFSRLLDMYVFHKLKARKLSLYSLRSHFIHESSYLHNKSTVSFHEQQQCYYRNKLASVWPCDKCKQLFNPTKRNQS